MKYISFLLFPSCLLAAQVPEPVKTAHILFIEDHVSQVGRASTILGTTTAASSEYHSAPGVTGEIRKRCAVPITLSQADADLTLITHQGATQLVDKKGLVLYVSPARTVGNMAKDVCKFLKSY